MIKLETIKLDLIIKNKNQVFNLAIIFLLLYIALRIYSYGNNQQNRLLEQKDQELKKNKVIENIASLEKVIGGYKKSLVKQDLSSFMNTISDIAKSSSIEIFSIKPLNEEVYEDYAKFSFAITAKAPNYHSFAGFISKVEHYKDVYFVDEVTMTPSKTGSFGDSGGNMGLDVSLKISNIFYL